MKNNVNSFDVIMENCPFLKKIILEKINSEVEPLKKQIDDLTKVLYQASILPEPEKK